MSLGSERKAYHFRYLPFLGRCTPGVKYEKIEGNKLVVTMPDGRERRLEADTFVVAAGSKPRQDLHSELKRTVPEVHLIGDAAEPRNVRAAIAKGWKAGNEI